MPDTRAPHRTRVAVVAARPGFEAGARVSSPPRERTKSTVCRTLRRGGRERPRICLYACLRYPAVRARAADDLGYYRE